MQRFAVNQQRAERVASHALTLYDNTKDHLHRDDGSGRELLWAAAMLHACGQHINLSAYHKHSWYLIRHGELLGYSEAEHLMVAAIARYHRRSLPKKRHESLQALQSRDNLRTVSDIALLLRLAVAIDRRPEPVVKILVVKVKNEDLVLQLIGENADQDLSLEQWSLESCTPILREITGLNLKLKVQE